MPLEFCLCQLLYYSPLISGFYNSVLHDLATFMEEYNTVANSFIRYFV